MSEQANINTLTAVLGAFNRNDLDAAAEGVDPEVTYIIRGRAAVSGTYRGHDAIANALRRVKELTAGTMVALPEVIVAKGDVVMAYMHVTGTRPDGRTYDNYQAYLYRFRNGKLIEGQTIPVDQHAFEEFFAD